MKILVDDKDFDVGAEIAALRAGNPHIGAVASFVGLVRDTNAGSDVASMTLEHYPAMTQRALEAIVAEAGQRWTLLDVTVIHRVGELQPSDQIVLVAVASSHRADAFSACKFIMDYLKTQAPFWKKEQTPEGARWVEQRATDEQAAARWSE
ncbi:MAG TPA: molybdopterin synthase catalytic subunit MoaE [Sulfuriferula sp.]|nr:molybdopterin synthase catalytic subunit MoaE [Sulfuriferula sp.]